MKSYTDILENELVIKVFNGRQGRWGLGNAELCVLNALVVALEADSIFEFVTCLGRTTLNMFHNAKEGSKITTLGFPVDQQRIPEGQRAGVAATILP